MFYLQIHQSMDRELDPIIFGWELSSKRPNMGLTRPAESLPNICYTCSSEPNQTEYFLQKNLADPKQPSMNQNSAYTNHYRISWKKYLAFFRPPI